MKRQAWIALLAMAALAFAGVAASLPHNHDGALHGHDSAAKPCATCHVIFNGMVLALGVCVLDATRSESVAPVLVATPHSRLFLSSAPSRAPPA